MVIENKFKDILKELRIEKGLTQASLAKQIGLSQTGIARWENGDRTPNIYCLVTLAKFFGVTTDFLLGIEI